MANTLTNLAADLHKAADTVGRESIGVISSCLLNANGSERVALNDTVRSHFTRVPSASVAITESMTIPQGTDQVVDSKTLSITKAQSITIPWTGEDVKHVDNGAGFTTVYGDQILQGMRVLANEIESDLVIEAYTNASRAFGTAGTTPFGSNFNEIAEVRQILVDNGCPMDMVSLVVNTAAGTNLRQLASLQKVNESGGDDMLRRGELLNLQSFSIKESAQIPLHTIGTGAGYLINNVSNEVIGEETLTVDTGTGTIVVGDVITHASDSVNKYMVNTALTGGVTVVIGEPGLKIQADNNDAITVGSAFTPNLAFHRNALELAIRAPAMPEGGDAADDSMIIQDPVSGLVFEVRSYKGYHKNMFEIGVAYGFKAWKPQHIAVLLG